jgi:hypothetical protein
MVLGSYIGIYQSELRYNHSMITFADLKNKEKIQFMLDYGYGEMLMSEPCTVKEFKEEHGSFEAWNEGNQSSDEPSWMIYTTKGVVFVISE